MSGANLSDGHGLIQIGVAVRAENGTVDTFSALMRPRSMGEGWWDERAAQVHKFTVDEVAAAPPADEVDAELHAWLLARGATANRRTLIPVGFNVVGFDMPFVRQELPLSSTVISRRGIDLNAICFLLDGLEFNPKAGNARGWAGWKRSAKKAVEKTVTELFAGEKEAHDAGFDAAQALLAFEWFRSQLPATNLFTPPKETRLIPEALQTKLGLADTETVVLEDLFVKANITNVGRWLSRKNPEGVNESWLVYVKRRGSAELVSYLSSL